MKLASEKLRSWKKHEEVEKRRGNSTHEFKDEQLSAQVLAIETVAIHTAISYKVLM